MRNTYVPTYINEDSSSSDCETRIPDTYIPEDSSSSDSGDTEIPETQVPEDCIKYKFRVQCAKGLNTPDGLCTCKASNIVEVCVPKSTPEGERYETAKKMAVGKMQPTCASITTGTVKCNCIAVLNGIEPA